MPAIAFDDVDTALEPVPAWRFYCALPDLPGIASAGSTLSFLVQRFTGTHRGIMYEQTPFQAGARNFPTGFHTDNIQIVVVENDRFLFTQVIRAWAALVIDLTGAYGLPATYKKSITVDALDETGAVLETFSWDFCSPTVQDPFDWDGASTHYLLTGCGFVTDGPRTASTSTPTGTASAAGTPSGTTPPTSPTASDLDTAGSSVGYN